ncbi:MAG: AAA family ATPase [Thermoleophilia bacterium]|nr:AAA family ATPase [Thermoleophilia bacterium]
MRLTELDLRFFRSFNYDYERRARLEANEVLEWDLVEGQVRPFVRVLIEPDVTAIVGANESGKSHLVDAAAQALTGAEISREDFCRYSPLFSVEKGGLREPDLGLEAEIDKQDLRELEALGERFKPGDRIRVVRRGDHAAQLFEPDGTPIELSDSLTDELLARLPVPEKLETRVSIPDEVSYEALREEGPSPLGTRIRRSKMAEALDGVVDVPSLNAKADEIVSAATVQPSHEDLLKRQAGERMARQLLFDVAQIDPERVNDLSNAIRDGKDGQAKAIEGQMNEALTRRLNFSHVWRQDKDFRLLVDAQEYGLSFTVHDRTGRSYSFNERSKGLSFFLSYYIQLLAMKRPEGRPVLLLVDEPDAYLSGEGQQDLLTILEEFARPSDYSRRDQVIYVTHSPFLINRNAGHRIRVLDKGTNDQGTRVVKDVARTHYEPLRSALGPQVAETAFIGGANLIVEGLADQILLAGMNTRLRRIEKIPPSELLDLNNVTVVPSGGAPNVPYLVYLARGRDALKPPCVALLDSDNAGQEAVKRLRKSDVGGKPLLGDEFIVQVGELAEQAGCEVSDGLEIKELEDLIPMTIAVSAAVRCADHTPGLSAANELSVDEVVSKMGKDGVGLFAALKAVYSDAFEGAELPKVGFAREVVGLVAEHGVGSNAKGLRPMQSNFRLMIGALAGRLENAQRDESRRRRGGELDRLVSEFLAENVGGLVKDKANQFLRRVEAGLEEGEVADEAVRSEIARLRGDFELSQNPLDEVKGFDDFRHRVEALPVKRREAPQVGATLSIPD